MKRLISAVIALSLLGTAAASAQPYRGGNGNYDRGTQNDYRSGHDAYNRDYRTDYRSSGWNHNRNDGAALVGLGIGLFALAAIASSHDHADYRYQQDGYYGR